MASLHVALPLNWEPSHPHGSSRQARPRWLDTFRCANTLRTCFCCCRALTALSTTLGQMVVALHQGLLAAVAQEPLLPVLAVVLRALCAMLAAAPYDRLPQSLLPDLVTVGAPVTWSCHGPCELRVH